MPPAITLLENNKQITPDPMEVAIKSSIDQLKAELQNQPKPSKANIGKTILKELNPVCEAIAGTSLQKVLENTPGAGLQKRKTPAEKKKDRRVLMKNVKQKLELGYNEQDCNFILVNRVSWSKFNTMHLEQSYESKKDAIKRVAEKGIKKKAWHKEGEFGN